MAVDARNEIFDHIELFDAPAMFDPGGLTVIEPFVAVNHAGTIIGIEDYMLEQGQAKYIATHINFLGDEITLAEFCAENGIEISEPKKGVLDSLKENKAKVAKTQPSSKHSKEETR